MCGIVGYIGKQNASEILVQGLTSLEYRGYDSSGIALSANHELEVIKSSGKLELLKAKLAAESSNSSVLTSTARLIQESTRGIGHTRWATHGAADDINAHPHQSEDSQIALVHNGIIKNFYQIKSRLLKAGYKFQSQTDTEVIVQLLSEKLSKHGDQLTALRETMKELDGSFAIAIVLKDQEEILVAKNQTPLLIGIGEGENFIASDSSTLLQFTSDLVKLQDRTCARIKSDSIAIYDQDGNSIEPSIQHLTKSISILDKGPYKHFLLKEIHEQSSVIATMLGQSLPNIHNPVQGFEQINTLNIDRIIFVACGSAYHAALVGKYLIELWAKIRVEVVIASEFTSLPSLLSSRDLVIGISQSGETADTLSAIAFAKDSGAQVMAITNQRDSAIYDLAHPNTYVTPAGIEVSVASTKAFTSQLMALYLFALYLAESQGISSPKLKEELHKLPLIIDQVLERSESYKDQCLKYSHYKDFIFLSRGINYPIALEAALKLKELSYINAIGYPSGEMKHGPIAILDQNVPVLTIAIDGQTELEQNIYRKSLSNAQEARARKSPSLVLACDGNSDVPQMFDDVIYIPEISQVFSPIIVSIPLQFLAYYIAEELGKDVDQPRNLAKSVTVE